jgi:hypothetical protein
MRRFVVNILLFCGLVLAMAVVGAFAYRMKLQLLPLKPDIVLLICGDSHIRSALDARIIPNAVNIAHTSEHYLYTYQKLKLLLSRHPGIRCVVLGASYHSFSAFYDTYVSDSPTTLAKGRRDVAVLSMYPRYFLMMDREGKWFILSHAPKCVLHTLRSIAAELASLFTAGNFAGYPFWGEEYHSDHTCLDEPMITQAIKLHFYDERGGMQGFSSSQLPSLARIIRLCRARNVMVFILNTPIHPRYAARIPPGFIINYYRSIDAVAGDNVHFLDYHDYAYPDSCFGDGHHLNARGEAHFSRMVHNDISEATGAE